ncbi:OVARIAN TUMOR DOMAIN-containing deubiquitinating enzyme 1 [Sesamum angolense]|uniref:ubiquitinyl hydrolase 1 n=1 Tax=Sesamum angolense TaxID=2727404 RepID=A0AAE2BYM1_9LAMI|nr:OVARIAN TUMOR DOMAIN-containing deubiquitinating enzyme 1 [Sesamum angolense]
MQNQDGHVVESGTETITSIKASEIEDWANFRDDDILQQQSAIQAEEAGKIPFVGDKARMPLSSFQLICTYYIAYFERFRTYLRNDFGCAIAGATIFVSSRIQVRKPNFGGENQCLRTRGDGIASFVASCLLTSYEHILQTQDRAEVDRITANVEQCRKTLLSLGYAEFTFEDFLRCSLSNLKCSVGDWSFHKRSRDQSVSDYVLQVVSGTMGEESDHVHITALSDALGVPIRIVYLDRSCDDKGSVSVNHHDFTPAACHITNANSGATQAAKPFINLLYRPGTMQPWHQKRA